MIVAQRKPFSEIKQALASYQKIMMAGCGTCVAVCLAGGKKEVGLLASQLRMSFGLDGKEAQITEATLERQCDREFLETLKDKVEQADAVLSLACGAGIQFLAEAVSLSTVGGVVGVLLGVIVSQALVRGLGWPALVTSSSILIAFAFAAAVGIFFGYYPARKASSLDPIEALRYE